MSRKETIEAIKKSLATKDIYIKNPILDGDFIDSLLDMFLNYAEPRNKKADIRDILVTATSLGLNNKFRIVFKAMEEIAEQYGGDSIDFQTFLRQLTNRLGSPFSEEGRRATFSLIDVEGKGELGIDELTFINEQLKYGFTEPQLRQIITTVGGSFDASTISADKWNRYIEKRVTKAKLGLKA